MDFRTEIEFGFLTKDKRKADAQHLSVERLDENGNWVALTKGALSDGGWMTGNSPWDGTWPPGFDAGYEWAAHTADAGVPCEDGGCG